MNEVLHHIISEAARCGAMEAVKALKPSADRISQAEAFRSFGRAFVEAHKHELTVTGSGCRLYYSRAELVEMQAANSVNSILNQINKKQNNNGKQQKTL